LNKENLKRYLEKLKSAYKRLKEVLNYSPNDWDIVLDATVQRFEFTFELSWKTIKRFAEILAAGECKSGRSCIKLAYRLGWIKDEKVWLNLLEARNLTSHTYDYEIAMRVYQTVKENIGAFEELIESLEKELKNL